MCPSRDDRRRPLTRWAWVLLLLSPMAACQCPSSSPPSPPVVPSPPAAPAPAPAAGLAAGAFKGFNVVLVSFDAARARSMSCYGYSRSTTPNLDRLVKESVLFQRNIAAGSWTVPSTMSIFTALWPTQHKVLNKYMGVKDGKGIPTVLSDKIKTMPEVLGKAGYRLVGFTGDAGASGRFGFNRGFEVYLDDRKFGGFDYSVPAAQTWLRENKDSRFFMWLHGYDVHGQYDPPGGYRRVFAGDYKGPLKGGKVEQGELRERLLAERYRPDEVDKPGRKLTAEDYAFHAALYDEKILDADRRFASFLATLDELGLRQKTIIVVTSDHGEEFGEHDNFDHGPTLYDEMVRVPLIFNLPGGKAARVSGQVRNVDIMPTVFDLLGQPLPEGLSGVSLLPALQGKPQSLTAFAETDYRLVTHRRAIIDPDARYKFILTLETEQKELYDLHKDPAETVNLVKSEPRVAYELEQNLVKWMLAMGQDPAQFRGIKEEMIKEY